MEMERMNAASEDSAFQLRSRSALAVEALMAARAGVRKFGFAAAVREQWPEDADLHEAARAIIPDAYEFHADLAMLTIIEVVDSHPIRADKAARIGALSYAVQGHEWELTVAVFDKYGQLTAEVPGWCFSAEFVGRFAGSSQTEDYLPAALAVMRECADAGTFSREELELCVNSIGL